jgi:hypothetical protein
MGALPQNSVISAQKGRQNVPIAVTEKKPPSWCSVDASDNESSRGEELCIE